MNSSQVSYWISYSPFLTDPSFDYLMNLSREAFGHVIFDKKKTQLTECCRIFQLKNADSVWLFSPRAAKQFINKLVAGYLQWPNVSLISTALYHFVGDQIRKQPGDLLTGTFPDEKLRPMSGQSNWQEDFYWLLFLVDPVKSKHTLLNKLISESIATGQPNDVMQYKSLEGVGAVVCTAIRTYLRSTPDQAIVLHRTIDTLSALQVIVKNRVDDFEGLQVDCKNYLLAMTNWYQLRTSVVPAILKIIDEAPVQEQQLVVKSVIESIEKNTSDPPLEDWLIGLELLVDGLLERKLLTKESKIILASKSDIYHFINLHKLNNLKSMGFPSLALSHVILEAAHAFNIDEGYYRLMLAYRDRIISYDWSNSLALMATGLSKADSMNEINIRSCLKILLLLTACDVPGSLDVLKTLKDTYHYQRWMKSYCENAETAAALLLAGISVDAGPRLVSELYKLDDYPKDPEQLELVTSQTVYVNEAIHAAAELAIELDLLSMFLTGERPEYIKLFVKRLVVDCEAILKKWLEDLRQAENQQTEGEREALAQTREQINQVNQQLSDLGASESK